MKKSTFVTFVLFLFYSILFAQNTRDIFYYQNKAKEYNPVYQQNLNSIEMLHKQDELTKIQNKKLQVYIASDILLTPSFFDGGKLISFVYTEDTKPIGYDVLASSRALFSAQVNAMKSLFTKRTVNTYISANTTLRKSIEQANKQQVHDLEKTITDQYIAIYQIQQEIESIQKIQEKANNRQTVIKELVKNGILPESDYLQISMVLLDQQNDLELLRLQQINNFGQLNILCNIQDTIIYTLLRPSVTLTAPVKDFQFLERYRTDSTYFEKQQEVNDTKYLPQFSIYGNTGYYSITLSTLYRNFGISAGARLTVPIYDGGQKNNMKQQYQIEKHNLSIIKDYSLQQQTSNLRTLLQQIRATEKSLELIDKQLESHTMLLNILKDKIVLGQTSINDYIVSLEEFTATSQKRVNTETSMLLLMNQYNYLNW